MLWPGKQAKEGWFCALCQEKEQNKGQKKSLGVQRRAEESGPLGRGYPTDGEESPMIKVSRWRWGGANRDTSWGCSPWPSSGILELGFQHVPTRVSRLRSRI